METRLRSSAVFECTTDHRQVGKVLEGEQFLDPTASFDTGELSAGGRICWAHIHCVRETFVRIQACAHTTGFYFLLGYSL